MAKSKQENSLPPKEYSFTERDNKIAQLALLRDRERVLIGQVADIQAQCEAIMDWLANNDKGTTDDKTA